MRQLTTAAQAIDTALAALDHDGHGQPPGFKHWLEARAYLLESKAEVGRALQLAALGRCRNRSEIDGASGRA